MKIEIYPKNKKHFVELKRFGQQILELCEDLNVKPILYGSLAYFAFLKDEKIVVNDLDFLIREKDFAKIIGALEKRKIKHGYSKEWHTLQIFKGNLKVELDSVDFWQKDFPKDFVEVDFNGFVVRAVSLKSLRKIYKKASEVSKDNPEGNRKKFEKLEKL